MRLADVKQLKFPSRRQFEALGRAARRVQELYDSMQSLADTDDESLKHVFDKFFQAISGAVKKGKSGELIPVKIEGSWNNDPLMKSHVYESMISHTPSRKEGITLTYPQMLELSPRERGDRWDEITRCIEALQRARFDVEKIVVKMEDDHDLDRAWAYPATIYVKF